VFPSISTGACGNPEDRATPITVSVMKQYESKFDEIIACCFSAGDKAFCECLLAER
jgi:O-acetyl-ADP-ribose deacetylase (regulator of RNase III)